MAWYVLLADLLHLPEYKEPDQNKVREAVQHWFRKHTGWLLILDNMEDLKLLQQFVPTDRQGAVLLTTRRQVTEPVAQALELELLPENDAILFLLKRTKILAIDKSLKDASDGDIKAARAITYLLGNLPLALDQAGAYILETACSFADYVALFKTCQTQLLQRRIGEGIPTDHPEAVTTTLSLNFEQVQRRSNAVGELLCFCAFLAPDSIPEEILTAGAPLLGPVLAPLISDTYQLNEALVALRAYSLIERNPHARTLTIHRLVQMVLRDSMPTETQQHWMQCAVHAVATAYPAPDFANWSALERLLPHALVCATWIEQAQDVWPKASILLVRAGDYLRTRGRYRDAEPLLQRALAIAEQELGANHPGTGGYLCNLAVLYQEQGKYEQAEPLLQRALAIAEQELGASHPNTAISLSNLAMLYYMQGKYAQVEPLYQRALAIQEQHLGAEHPDTATSLNNLAMLYYMQGKYAQEEPLFQRALAIQEQHLGANHPDTTASLNNLAVLYHDQSRYEEAEPLYQRALAIREQHLGAEHPEVATSLNNLADLYQEQGKYEEAEPLYLRALAIQKQQSGTNHPNTAMLLRNLAALYKAQEKYEEAELLYLSVLAIQKQQLGAEHPEIATSLNNLAALYEVQEIYEEAEFLYQRALAIREQHLGTNHIDTALSLYNLAMLYYTQGLYSEAEPLYQQALAIHEQELGREHPRTQWIFKSHPLVSQDAEVIEAILHRMILDGIKQKALKEDS